MTAVPSQLHLAWRDAYPLGRCLANLLLIDRAELALARVDAGELGPDVSLAQLMARLASLSRRWTRIYQDSGPLLPAPEPDAWIDQQLSRDIPRLLWRAMNASEASAALVLATAEVARGADVDEILQSIANAIRNRGRLWESAMNPQHMAWWNTYKAGHPPGRLPGIRTTQGGIWLPRSPMQGSKGSLGDAKPPKDPVT